MKQKSFRHTLEFETPIAVSAEKLYAFHTDSANLPKITPKDIKVDIIKQPQTIAQEALVVLDITKFGLKQRWEVKIGKHIPNELIKDIAIQSPLSYFEHDHIFEKVDDTNSILKDKITFALPFAPLSNIILPLVKSDMQKMFIYRHQQTKEILEQA